MRSKDLQSLPEAAAIFTRDKKRPDHLCLQEVTVELNQLVQPETVPGEIIVRQIIRIPSQVAEVLHLYEPARQLARLERRVLCDEQERPGARCRIIRRRRRAKLRNYRGSI